MSIADLLDRAIATVAPGRALQRSVDRYNLARVQEQDRMRRFEAATLGRRGADWPLTSGTIDSELRGSLSRLRARSRDAEQNNAWAACAIRCLSADVVGTDMTMELASTAGPDVEVPDAVRSPFMRKWHGWAYEKKRCDLRARHNLPTLMYVAARELFVAGEVLVRRVFTGESGVPFRLQLLEADHLDVAKDGLIFEDGRRIIQGVEINRFGQVIALWILREHPGDYGALHHLTSDRVRIEDMIHVFEPWRAGQLRGIPRGTPALLVLRDDDVHFDARLVQQKVASNYVGFIHDIAVDIGGLPSSTVIGDKAKTTDDPDTRRFTGGTFQKLPPGKTISFGTPPSVDGWADVQKLTLRKVSAGYDVPYARMARDLEGSNYSNERTATLQYHASLDVTTWHVVVPDLCDRIFEWFVEWMTLERSIDASAVRPRWTPPRRPVVDPTKDIPALENEVRAGFKSRPEAVRELGYDWKQIDKENAAARQNAERLGLIYTSDAHVQEQGGDPTAVAGADAGDDPKRVPKKLNAAKK